MDIKKRDFLAAGIGAGIGLPAPHAMAWGGSPNPKDAGYVLNAIELGNDA